VSGTCVDLSIDFYTCLKQLLPKLLDGIGNLIETLQIRLLHLVLREIQHIKLKYNDDGSALKWSFMNVCHIVDVVLLIVCQRFFKFSFYRMKKIKKFF
jgi:hypothetical protein